MCAPEIVDAIGGRAPEGRIDEVVHVAVDGIPGRAEFAPAVLGRPDQLFLLRVHGEDGLVRGEVTTDRVVDVLELRVPIGMRGAFQIFAVRVQPVAEPG